MASAYQLDFTPYSFLWEKLEEEHNGSIANSALIFVLHHKRDYDLFHLGDGEMIDKNCSTPEFVAPSEVFLGVSDKLSFRQIAALVAMHAVTGRNIYSTEIIYLTEIANISVELADELITALEKKANDG